MAHASCDEGTDTVLPPPDSVRARYSRLSTGLRLFCSLSRSRSVNAESLLFRIYLTPRDCFQNNSQIPQIPQISQRLTSGSADSTPPFCCSHSPRHSSLALLHLSIILFILSPVPQSTVSSSTNFLGCWRIDPGPIWCRCPSIPFWNLFQLHKGSNSSPSSKDC